MGLSLAADRRFYLKRCIEANIKGKMHTDKLCDVLEEAIPLMRFDSDYNEDAMIEHRIKLRHLAKLHQANPKPMIITDETKITVCDPSPDYNQYTAKHDKR